MPIPVKNQSQIALMRQAGRILAQAHAAVRRAIAPGVTTAELDAVAEACIAGAGAVPSFKGYRGFPASICVSVNNEVIHGIPGLKQIKSGDIVSIDIGACWQGYHADAARTHCVGSVSPEAKRLIDVCRESFYKGIAYAKAGNYLGQISAAIEDHAAINGFSVVRTFVGHGIGKALHEPPQIPHFRTKSRGPKLAAGMTLAIEPMVNAGSCEVTIQTDGWGVVTNDGSLSAHYENTVLITQDGCEILTGDAHE